MKIFVTKQVGPASAHGLINPIVGMTTNYGPILSIGAGTGTVIVGVGTGDTPRAFHPHDLFVTVAHATGVWSYPTGDGSVQFGHTGIWPNGAVGGVGTGIAYGDGDDTVNVFGR